LTEETLDFNYNKVKWHCRLPKFQS